MKKKQKRLFRLQYKDGMGLRNTTFIYATDRAEAEKQFNTEREFGVTLSRIQEFVLKSKDL